MERIRNLSRIAFPAFITLVLAVACQVEAREPALPNLRIQEASGCLINSYYYSNWQELKTSVNIINDGDGIAYSSEGRVDFIPLDGSRSVPIRFDIPQLDIGQTFWIYDKFAVGSYTEGEDRVRVDIHDQVVESDETDNELNFQVFTCLVNKAFLPLSVRNDMR